MIQIGCTNKLIDYLGVDFVPDNEANGRRKR